jgi:plasmid stabilization system protein ParE
MPAACSAGEGEKAGAVLYYRALQPGLIEIVRVLIDRMEPSRHFDTVAEDKT